MSPPSIARPVPAPARGNISRGTLLTQLLGTFVFAFALFAIVALRARDPFVIGILAAGAFGVFAGGNAHRGSIAALALCYVFDLGIAGAALARVPEATAFVSRTLAAWSINAVLLMTITGAFALVAAVACLAAMPQARRFAAWRGNEVLRAARVYRG